MNKDLIEIVMGLPVTTEEQKRNRVELTDFLKDTVFPYYESKGSNNPNRIYTVYSKLLKDILFDVSPSFEKIYRGCLMLEQMKILAHAEKMCIEFLRSGMADGLEYKDLYKFVRDELTDLELPKTKVPHSNYISDTTKNTPAITHNQKAS